MIADKKYDAFELRFSYSSRANLKQTTLANLNTTEMPKLM